jgi:Putative mono-oxygenase ydhR
MVARRYSEQAFYYHPFESQKGEIHMITEIVTFKLPEGMTHEDVVANFEKTAPNWRANPDLIRKNYLVDAINRVAGGVYLWKERAHAEKWHGEAFRQKVKEIYGSEPEIQYFDTPIVVDNVTGEIVKS